MKIDIKNVKKIKKTNIKKIIFFYVLIMICVLFISFLTQYIFTGTNLFEGLGVLPINKCSGSLSISKTGCVFKAKISMNGCLGKTYEIKENSCLGSVKCKGLVGYDSTQTTCGWKDSSGSRKYVLCVDNELKDSVLKTC
jgi:hypothetical protein